MSNDLMLDVGQANELKLAFRRADFSNDDIKRLCEGNVLADVRRVLLGHAAISVVEHVIDCDAQPYLPDDWSVEEHQKGGAFTWDKETQKNALYLSKGQAGSSYIVGNMLRKELRDMSIPVLNANVLDYLLKNPHLIPLEWKGTYVFFWGTIYRAGSLCVRGLYWDDGRWRWGDVWLDDDFSGNDPAAVRAT
jgi:hypothetical protein